MEEQAHMVFAVLKIYEGMFNRRMVEKQHPGFLEPIIFWVPACPASCRKRFRICLGSIMDLTC